MEALATLAFDMAPIGIVLTENRVIRACNATFCELTGFAKADLMGQSFRMLYASDSEYDRVRDLGLHALSKGEDYSDLRLLQRANGEVVWCRFRANALNRDDPLAQTVLTFARLLDTPQSVSLTKRERDVVLGLRSGHTSKQIAAALGLSTRTIEDVRARLLKKFQASTTHEVVGKFTSLEG